jgi:hypothetical protein
MDSEREIKHMSVGSIVSSFKLDGTPAIVPNADPGETFSERVSPEISELSTWYVASATLSERSIDAKELGMCGLKPVGVDTHAPKYSMQFGKNRVEGTWFVYKLHDLSDPPSKFEYVLTPDN